MSGKATYADSEQPAHDAEVSASPSLKSTRLHDAGDSCDEIPAGVNIECLAGQSNVAAECGVSEAACVKKEVAAAVEDVVANVVSSIEATPATATTMAAASDHNAADETTVDH
eukprot:INCI7501.3.p1 GENE.INCI7501.3~~INCI7501.3.p1  ORF type:complete len:113 (-),score=37.93 INCI7501.3:104-442(-)